MSAVAVSNLGAMSCELTCLESSSLIAQNTIEKIKLIMKIPVFVPVVVVSKPWAMSCKLTC